MKMVEFDTYDIPTLSSAVKYFFREAKMPLLYGTVDIVLDRVSRTSQLHPTPHATCAVLYFVPMLIGC